MTESCNHKDIFHGVCDVCLMPVVSVDKLNNFEFDENNLHSEAVLYSQEKSSDCFLSFKEGARYQHSIDLAKNNEIAGKLSRDVDNLLQERGKLKEQNAILIEALKFYQSSAWDDSPQGRAIELGKYADEALKKVGVEG